MPLPVIPGGPFQHTGWAYARKFPEDTRTYYYDDNPNDEYNNYYNRYSENLSRMLDELGAWGGGGVFGEGGWGTGADNKFNAIIDQQPLNYDDTHNAIGIGENTPPGFEKLSPDDAPPGIQQTSLKPNLEKMDPRLKEIIDTAIQTYGQHVEITPHGGYRAGDSRQHGKGRAVDVQIYDSAGRAIPNYQSPAAYQAYQDFANHVRDVQMQLHPELAGDFRWGGYFSGPLGVDKHGKPLKYGAMDLMHFDLGGLMGLGMAAGSWKHGLDEKWASKWGVANAPSLTTAKQQEGLGTSTINRNSGHDRIAALQGALKQAGYNPGTIDGKWGKNTRAAVQMFQQAAGLTADGRPGPQTLGVLSGLVSASATKDDYLGPAPGTFVGPDGMIGNQPQARPMQLAASVSSLLPSMNESVAAFAPIQQALINGTGGASTSFPTGPSAAAGAMPPPNVSVGPGDASGGFASIPGASASGQVGMNLAEDRATRERSGQAIDPSQGFASHYPAEVPRSGIVDPSQGFADHYPAEVPSNKPTIKDMTNGSFFQGVFDRMLGNSPAEAAPAPPNSATMDYSPVLGGGAGAGGFGLGGAGWGKEDQPPPRGWSDALATPSPSAGLLNPDRSKDDFITPSPFYDGRSLTAPSVPGVTPQSVDTQTMVPYHSVPTTPISLPPNTPMQSFPNSGPAPGLFTPTPPAMTGFDDTTHLGKFADDFLGPAPSAPTYAAVAPAPLPTVQAPAPAVAPSVAQPEAPSLLSRGLGMLSSGYHAVADPAINAAVKTWLGSGPVQHALLAGAGGFNWNDFNNQPGAAYGPNVAAASYQAARLQDMLYGGGGGSIYGGGGSGPGYGGYSSGGYQSGGYSGSGGGAIGQGVGGAFNNR